MSLPVNEQQKALTDAVLAWDLRNKKGASTEQIAKKLRYGSVEALRSQLENWGMPSWILGEEATTASRSTATQRKCKRERKARSSGPVTELPPASNAMPLFAEKLKALAYGNEDLVHRKEKLQGDLFAQSAIYTDPAYVPRHNYSDEEWRDLCELYDLDPEDTGFWETDKKSWSLGGGTWAPQEPLPALIAAYVLMDGEIEPLLDALYPGTATPEVFEKIRKNIEGKKGTDDQDGLKVVARRLARLVRGGNIDTGSPPPDITSHEYNVACRITELREQGWADGDIYERLCKSKGFAKVLSSSQVRSSWEEFQRLAGLQLRFQDIIQ